VVLVLSLNVSAEITLPQVIGSNMVLQRNQPVAIWGHALAGEKVTVIFGKQVKKIPADTSAKWIVHLDNMPASDKPVTITISGSSAIKLNNMLVGEVWVCAGESNMEFMMAKSYRSKHDRQRRINDSCFSQAGPGTGSGL
jgi:sialate O-acetylesterase